MDQAPWFWLFWFPESGCTLFFVNSFFPNISQRIWKFIKYTPKKMKEKTTRLNFLWINFSMASKDLGRYLIQWSTSLHYLYQKLSIQRKTEESTTEHQKVLLFNRFCCAPPLWPLYQKCQIYHHDAFLDSFYIKMLTTFPEKKWKL